MAGGLGGGVLGATVGLLLTAAYLASFGSWPPDIEGEVLFVLAFPAFSALGWFLGFAVGCLAGGVGGSILAILLPARR